LGCSAHLHIFIGEVNCENRGYLAGYKNLAEIDLFSVFEVFQGKEQFLINGKPFENI